jgi:aconitate hydratase
MRRQRQAISLPLAAQLRPCTASCRNAARAGGRRLPHVDISMPRKAPQHELPYSMKVLLENLLRNEDGRPSPRRTSEGVAAWLKTRARLEHEIAFRPARVLMQDFTGVPAVVDLAAMRDAMKRSAATPRRSTRWCPSISSSTTRSWSTSSARQGLRQERRARIRAQQERYSSCAGARGVRQFPRRAARHRHLPPGEPRIPRPDRLDRRKKAATFVAYPDTLVGTDSHTTMVNGLACSAGASAASRRKRPCSASRSPMLIPEVIGFKLTGKLKEGAPPPTSC